MGTADKAKGKLKEAVGSVTGSDDLRKEGQAQQHKGRLEEKAARHARRPRSTSARLKSSSTRSENARHPDATFRTGPWRDCQGPSSQCSSATFDQANHWSLQPVTYCVRGTGRVSAEP